MWSSLENILWHAAMVVSERAFLSDSILIVSGDMPFSENVL